jgi:hypothetical protein
MGDRDLLFESARSKAYGVRLCADIVPCPKGESLALSVMKDGADPVKPVLAKYLFGVPEGCAASLLALRSSAVEGESLPFLSVISER